MGCKGPKSIINVTKADRFIDMIQKKRSLFSPALKMVVCIPSGVTEVEKRADEELANVRKSEGNPYSLTNQPQPVNSKITMNTSPIVSRSLTKPPKT